MKSTVLILPLALREAGNALGEALGYGPDNYTIPLAYGESAIQTHVALRADSEPSFVELVQNAQAGIYPPDVPVDLIAPIAAAIIADFSDELWGYEHAIAVLDTCNFNILPQVN
jgi:hypothetical protein